MKHITRITTAALFGATMLATPALAQSDGNPSDAPSNTDNQTQTMKPDAGAKMSVDSGTTAAVDGDFESAMGMIGNSGSASTIESMPDVGDVRIVGMSQLSGVDGDMPRLNEALAQNDAEVQKLRSVVSANPTITAELEAHGKSASDVIAADVAANGSVIVYTR